MEQDYKDMLGTRRWLFPNRGVPRIENDPDGDGSCVFAKAAGRYFGVAKKADVVIAKIDRYDDSTVMDALRLVLEDIQAHSPYTQRNVISLAFSKSIKRLLLVVSLS